MASQSLQGVGVIEKDVNGDLISWYFPALDKDLETVIKSRCGLNPTGKDNEDVSFHFSKFRSHWIYVQLTPIDSTKNNKVVSAAIFVVSQIFNPAKYEALLKLFTAGYLDKSSPMPIMQYYLSVFTAGKVATPYGNFADADFDNRRAFISPLRKIFDIFGMDAIVIWVAMLCRKRVFVYGENLSDLLPIIRAFPLLGSWHRQNFDLLRPFMTLSELELKDLSSCGVYVAGFTDPECANKKDYYDLFVSLSTRSFTINEHSKDSFILTKFHKQTAETFVKLSETHTDQQFIREVAIKTKELLDNLQSLKTPSESDPNVGYITLEALSQQKLPRDMDKFLFNVALAEGMCKR